MRIWYGPAEVPAQCGPSVVTIGNFDGVHRGHQAVLTAMVAQAHRSGYQAIAMTFDPHPKAVHDPAHMPNRITGIDDRLERMAHTGLDATLVINYDLEFAAHTPEDFVEKFLVKLLGAKVVLVGSDTRFGRGNAGDLALLEKLGERHGFAVEAIGDLGIETGRRWSSTWIRELLDEGKLSQARSILGYDHRLRGTVIPGDQLGREIGFPTANLKVTGGMIPRHGVYAGWFTVVKNAPVPTMDAGEGAVIAPLQERFAAAVSIGVNYTVGGEDVRVEAHLIDSPKYNLYGSEVLLDLVEWRRPMYDFGSLEALIQALDEDVAWCREVLDSN